MGDRPDKLIRRATALVVVAVAVFAAIVSYSHIFDLGHTHGQHGAAGRLLPLSVDGLILAASLVLLHEARNARSAPPLARVMLWLGIIATITANVAYGVGYGVIGAVISAWPAIAFIGSAEMAMGLVRRARLGDMQDRQTEARSVASGGDIRTRVPDLIPRPSVEPAPTAVMNLAPVMADTSDQTSRAVAAPGRASASQPQIPKPRTRRTRQSVQRRPATPERAEVTFAAELADGNVPSLRAVRREMHVGTDRARELREHLADVASARRPET